MNLYELARKDLERLANPLPKRKREKTTMADVLRRYRERQSKERKQ